MLGIFEGTLELLLGILIGRKLNANSDSKPSMDIHLKEAQLDVRKRALDQYAEELVSRTQEINPIDQMTVQDALNREARAKSALRAVLLRSGCSEDDIGGVMDDVDGHQDGDGRR